MRASQRLQLIIELAERKARDAARALAVAQQKLAAEQQKLAQLEQYLQEYRTALLTQGRQGVSVQQLRLYHGFSANVEKAITQQSAQVANVGRQVEQVRRHWQTLDARHKGLEKLREARLQEERATADRLEQKALDEAVSLRRRLHSLR